MWMLVLGIAFAIAAWLTILLWSGWVRPLRRLRDQVLALSRGEWNRLLLSEPLPGELWTVLLRLEGLRRALLDRLRSSTELNLQLEGEVARRSAELARRNAALAQAVAKLQQAREELVRSERLAAVGSVVASLTSEINNPVSSMVSLVAPLKDTHGELSDCLLTWAEQRQQDDSLRLRAQLLTDELHEMLALLLRGGRRARDVVRAMRGYISTGTGEITTVSLLPLLADLYQLFAERLQPNLQYRLGALPLERELRSAMLVVEPVLVRMVRSDLTILLSRWLLRTIPRLGPEHRTQISIEPGLSSEIGPTIELRLEDNGPPLTHSELATWHELVTADQHKFAIQTRSQSTDCRTDGMTTELRFVLSPVLDRRSAETAVEDGLLGDAK